MDISAFEYALRSGLFVLILDGFDEVNYERREKYLQELNNVFSRKYPDLLILLSTRPEESALALDGYSVFHILPLTKSASVELIDQLEFDDEIKEKFKERLNRSIYETHKDFASNPLLLTMLLLTYDQVGDLPQKMHIFLIKLLIY
jgi:predicted NACHT family NTPase